MSDDQDEKDVRRVVGVWRPRTVTPTGTTDECAAIIAKMVDRAPVEIRRWLNTRTEYKGFGCVFRARIAHDVLSRLGVPSEPIYVVAELFTTTFRRWQERPGATQEEFVREKCWLVSNDPYLVRDANLGRRAFSPAHTKEEIDDKLQTHMLTYIPSAGQVVDLGLHPLARPARGLHPPAAIALDWHDGHAEHTWSWGTLSYRAWPSHDFPTEDYRSAGTGWNDGDFGKYAPIVKRIARGIQARRSPWRPL